MWMSKPRPLTGYTGPICLEICVFYILVKIRVSEWLLLNPKRTFYFSDISCREQATFQWDTIMLILHTVSTSTDTCIWRSISSLRQHSTGRHVCRSTSAHHLDSNSIFLTPWYCVISRKAALNNFIVFRFSSKIRFTTPTLTKSTLTIIPLRPSLNIRFGRHILDM